MSFRLRSVASLVVGLLLLQAADFLLTWLLLSGTSRGDVYESNPLARSILEGGGWLGLASFKLTITGVILAAVLTIASRRRRAAVRLLAVLCAVMIGVNAYSGSLLASSDTGNRHERQAQDRWDSLNRRMALGHEFVSRRTGLCDGVLDGRIGRGDAARQMGELVAHYTPILRLTSVGRLPDLGHDDELSLYFDYHLRQRASERGQVVDAGPASEAPFDCLTPPWLRAQ